MSALSSSTNNCETQPDNCTEQMVTNGTKFDPKKLEETFPKCPVSTSEFHQKKDPFRPENILETLCWREYGIRRRAEKTALRKNPSSKLMSGLSELPNSTELSIFRNRLAECKSLFHRNLMAHTGCVNAVEFSPRNEELLVSGGDDRRVLIWRTGDVYGCETIRPLTQMRVLHDSNIFCLVFNEDSTKLFSSGNDHQVILHDVNTKEPIDLWTLDNAVYSLSLNPTDDKVFMTASEDGVVKIWDTRIAANEDPCTLLAQSNSPFQAALYNPFEPQLVATANAKEGAQLWDVRKPSRCLMQYLNGKTDISLKRSAMSIRWNTMGTKLLSLRRKMMPAVYEVRSQFPISNLDAMGYHNSCTMKTCTFGGPDDSLIMSGSDDFNVYIWKYRKSAKPVKPLMVLKGHRSIVNQVRYSPVNHFIVSSGVEKVIKVWSPWTMPNKLGYTDSEMTSTRPMYTHEEYIGMVLRGGGLVRQEALSEDAAEDPRMLAFFDSLVQREIEDWNDSSEKSGSEDSDDDVYGRPPRGSSFSQAALRYSREVVDSESSSSESETDIADLPALPTGHQNNAGNLSDPDVSPNNSDRDISLDRYGGRFSPFSVAYAQYLRRQHSENQNRAADAGMGRSESAGELETAETSNANLEQLGLDPSLGYLPGQPDAVRSATELVIKKRQQMELEESRKARKRGRFVSESAAGTSGKSATLTAEEAKKRLGIAVGARKKTALTVRQRKLKHMRKIVLQDLADGTSSEEDSQPNSLVGSANNKTVNDHSGSEQLRAGPSSETDSKISVGSSKINPRSEGDQDNNVACDASQESLSDKKSEEKLFRKKKFAGKIRKRSSAEESD